MPETTALSRLTLVGVKAEAVQGTFAPPAAGDVVQIVNIPQPKPTIEKVERNIVKGSFGLQKPIAGIHSGTIELGFEMRAAGVTGGVSDQPEAHEILKNAMGRYRQAPNGTTVAGSTASAINLVTGTGANYQIGDVVWILNEVRFIIMIVADTITLNQALVQGAPAAATAVKGGHAYKPGTSGSDYTSLSVAMWMDAEISGPEFRGIGCKVSKFSVKKFEVGMIPSCEVTLEMVDHAELIGTAPASPVFEDQEPPVGLAGIASRADITIPMGSLEFEIGNKLSKEKDLNACGGVVRQFITGRDVKGSVNPLVDRTNVDLTDAWRANASFELFFVLGTPVACAYGAGFVAQGSAIAIYMPQVIFTTSERSDSDGLLMHKLGYTAHEAAGGNGNDEVYLGFV